jgi:excinuclease ABC subunit C
VPVPIDIDGLPTGPGVYLFKDAKGEVIYVGKAVNLRSRVRQYVAGQDARPTVSFLMSRATSVETTVTDTDAEAILLENNLIKKHHPRYNIQLRDDKDYVSLRINAGHQWPMVSVVRRPPPDKTSLTFGPYSSAGAVRETLRFLRKTFPLRTCRDTVLYNRARPCLEYQIGRCVAPCVDYVTTDEYKKLVDEVELFLRGKNAELQSLLKEEMREASGAQQYEKAAKLRDRLAAVERVLSEQKVASHDGVDRDVFGFYREGDRGAVNVLSVRGGRMVGSRNFVFDETAAEDAEVMTSVIAQFYSTREVPAEVLLPRESPDIEALGQLLGSTRGGSVDVATPQRGGKKDLVAMASSNAESAFRREHDEQASVRRDLESLARALDLEGPPARVECVDLSMIQGRAPVGAVVAFVDGRPAKDLYRRFHIKDLREMSDFAMMHEVLTRRFKRALEPDAGPWAPPDLLLVDGGKAQLSIAEAVLSELGIVDLPLAALAKDPEHGKAKGPSEERVFVPGRTNPVEFRREKGGMFLLQRVRDEAHRFAITFHRQTRQKSTLRSALDEIPGIGETRRRSLLRHFGSARKVMSATVDELAAAPSMNRATAVKVHRHFHRDGAAEPELET